MADATQRLTAAVNAYAADDEGLTPLAWNQVRADIAAALRAKDEEIASRDSSIAYLNNSHDGLVAEVVAAEQRAERLAGALRRVLMLESLGGMLPGTQQVVQSVINAARAALDAEGGAND